MLKFKKHSFKCLLNFNYKIKSLEPQTLLLLVIKLYSRFSRFLKMN